MAGTTVNYGFPYPDSDGSDLVSADTIKTPLVQIDTELKSIDGRMSASNSTNALTASTGFSIIEQVSFKRSGIGFIKATLKRTGATIAAVADGNIADVQCSSTLAAFHPHAAIQPFSTPVARSGNRVDGFMDDLGRLFITALSPGVALATNDEFNINYVYPLKTI